MKHAWILGLFMAPYSLLVPVTPGNPNGDPYAGQPGSTYDKAANPPQTIGVVTYDPYAPLPPQANNPIPVPASSLPAAGGALPPRQDRQ
jgi:hypothetical protein